MSGIGVPSYNSRQPSAVSKSRESEFTHTIAVSRQPSVSVSKSRESEFTHTEELNASDASAVSP